MKNWIINLSGKVIVKETKRWVLGSVIASCMLVLNWIGTLPDTPFIMILFISILFGIIFLFIQKWFFWGRNLIIFSLSLILVLIVKNSIYEKQIDSNEYIRTCDEVVQGMFSTDSIGWRLYHEKNPEMLAYLGCCMLKNCKNSTDLSYKIPLIKYADSLLTEANRSKNPGVYYFLGRAYMYFYGLGCEKSVKDAVLFAEQSLRLQKLPQTYCLLEKMELDSIEYPNLVEMVRIWRDSFDNANVRSYHNLEDLFIPSLSQNSRQLNLSFHTSVTNNEISSVLNHTGALSEDDKAIKRTYVLYESLYNGDTTSVAWKTLEENLTVMTWLDQFKPLLAAYYWGKGVVDSAHIYCDSIGYLYSAWNQSHNFNTFNVGIKTLDHDIKEHLDDVLHYSDLNELREYKKLTHDSLLSHALYAALKLREHRFLQSKDDVTWKETEKRLSSRTNDYIKKLRPRVR